MSISQEREYAENLIELLQEDLDRWQVFWNWLLEKGEVATIRHGWGDYSVKEWLLARDKEFRSSGEKVKK